jgi:hypothetical protein
MGISAGEIFIAVVSPDGGVVFGVVIAGVGLMSDVKAISDEILDQRHHCLMSISRIFALLSLHCFLSL